MSPSSRSIPGTEELNKLYQAMGFALSQWQFVEKELARIFSTALQNQNGAANSALFAVDSFYSKMQMTDTAIRQVLSPKSELKLEWDALYRKLDRARKTRNNIAHFSIVVRGDLDSTKHVYFLEPTWFDSESFFDETAASHHCDDVKNIGLHFDQVADSLAGFSKKLGGVFTPTNSK